MSAATKRSPSKQLGPLRREDGPGSSGYREWLNALLRQKAHQAAFKRAISKDRHPHFMAATKHAAAYAIGLPVQPTIDLTPKEPTALTALQLVEAIPRLLSILPTGRAETVKLLQGIEVGGEVVE